MDKLPKCGANYAPLTPVTFLKRAANVYSNRTSIIYGPTVRFTWRQTYERCCRLASALRSLNIFKNDVVSVLAPNIPAIYEMHFAVPMAGAVLNTINTRLAPKSIATILRHSEAKLLFVDYEYLTTARDALRLLLIADGGPPMPLVVVIDDIARPTGIRLGALEYEQLLLDYPAAPAVEGNITDEWDPIALNYTSGTTSEPKGVVYSHRGAFLSTLSLIVGWGMKTEPVFLWSLPMFHCNGWTFPWGVAARGGTNVCIRNTTADEIYRSIASHGVTHMCCAPVVFNILLEAEPKPRPLASRVEILTGGAPPPAALLERIEGLGFHVVHAYGMTEATGPALVCEWQSQWDGLGREDRAGLKARQGVSILTLADADVKVPETMESVPRDGKTMGEIMLRGSSIMKGYLKDEKATEKAFHRDGWFMTGDVGVVHPDGYVEIRDRSKDVIISGGENISSVEVEAVLYRHPAVAEAAVVAMPHPKWGESPCAFVTLRKDYCSAAAVDEAEIVRHCRENMSGFMVPKMVKFMEGLPKTSTGKIKKFQLRASLAKNKNHDFSNYGLMPTSSDQYYQNHHENNDDKGFALSRL